MASNDVELLKILCIHGYRQNDKSFREKTGALRKILKKHADLVYISAPNQVPPIEGAEDAVTTSDDRGWWFSRQDDYFNARDESKCCKGYEESLQVIRDAVKEHGPFDGVLGFSQGASMVSLMCALQEEDPEGCGFHFYFAILVAGFRGRTDYFQSLYKKLITMPTMHVFGDTDKVISKDLSEDLLQYFKEPLVLTHAGGHFVPASGPQKKVYNEFLGNRMTVKKEKQNVS